MSLRFVPIFGSTLINFCLANRFCKMLFTADVDWCGESYCGRVIETNRQTSHLFDC